MNKDTSVSRVFVFGAAPGKVEELSFPAEIRDSSRYISQVATGNSHVIFLLGNNQIMVCGSNQYGQIGFPKEKVPGSLEKPQINELEIDGIKDSYAVAIACGQNHTLILYKTQYENKKLVVFGSEVGTGFGDLQDVFVPKIQNLLKDDFKIENIEASSNRSVAYSEKGEVYMWGEGFFGNKFDTPKLCYKFNSKLVSFSLGLLHALAINCIF